MESISKSTRPDKPELPVQVVKNLQPAELRYVELSKGKKVTEFTQVELYKFSSQQETVGVLSDIVKSVILTSGIKNMVGDDFKSLLIDFHNRLLQFNNHTSIDDIREALSLGVCRKLTTKDNPTGKFHGLNVSTFMDWINIYTFQQERLSALSKAAFLDPNREQQIDKETLDKIFFKEINKAYNRYMETGTLEDVNNTFFDGLYSRKQIIITHEEKEALLEECVSVIGKHLVEKLGEDRPAINRTEFHERKRWTEELENLSTESPQVVSMAKRKLLKKFFDKMKTQSM